MRVANILAVARHALHTNLRTPYTLAGLGLLLAVTLLGPAGSLKNHGTWAFEPGMLGTGFAFGALFVFRSGLVEHRAGGMQEFLRANFITPVEHILACIVSLLVTWVGFGSVTFLIALTVSVGDLGISAWMAWVLVLMSGAMLPFVLMVESVSDLRTPLLVPGFIYFAALLVLVTTMGQPQASALLGLDLDPDWPGSSLPLAARAAVVMATGLSAVTAGAWLRARRRTARRSAARAS